MNGPLGYSAETSSLNCTLLSLIVTQPIFKKFMKLICVICILDSTKRLRLTLCLVRVQGVGSLGGHSASLCLGLEFYEVHERKIFLSFKKKRDILIHF